VLSVFSMIDVWGAMIQVTRLNGTSLYVNAEMIQYVEATPDTVITLMDGKKLVVTESPHEIADAVIQYRRQLCQPWAVLPSDASPVEE